MAATDAPQTPLDSIIRHVMAKVQADKKALKDRLDENPTDHEGFDAALVVFRASLKGLEILEQNAKQLSPDADRPSIPQIGGGMRRTAFGPRPQSPDGGDQRGPGPRIPAVDLTDISDKLGAHVEEVNGTRDPQPQSA